MNIKGAANIMPLDLSRVSFTSVPRNISRLIAHSRFRMNVCINTRDPLRIVAHLKAFEDSKVSNRKPSGVINKFKSPFQLAPLRKGCYHGPLE